MSSNKSAKVTMVSFVSLLGKAEGVETAGAVETIRAYHAAAAQGLVLAESMTQRELADGSGRSVSTLNRVLKLGRSFASADAAVVAFSAWYGADAKRSPSWTAWITSVGNEDKVPSVRQFDPVKAAAQLAKGRSAFELEQLAKELAKLAKAAAKAQ